MILLQAPYLFPEKTVIIPSADFGNTEGIQPPDLQIKYSQSGNLRSFLTQTSQTNSYNISDLKYEEVYKLEQFITEFIADDILLVDWNNTRWVGSFITDPLSFTYPKRNDQGAVSFEFIGKRL